jgi:subtilisin family serine protease
MGRRSLALVALAIALVSAAPGDGMPAEQRAEAAAAFMPLRTIPKRGGLLTERPLTSTVVVKFREGCDARVAVGKVELVSGFGTGRAAEAIAEAAPPGSVRPSFDRPAEELRAETAELEQAASVDLADLSLYFDVETASPEAAERLARELDALDEVEFAYVAFPPVPIEDMAVGPADGAPAGAPSAPTPDFTYLQGYLRSAQEGLGILPVRKLLDDTSGGRGAGVRIVDIEYSWNLLHEDLPFDESKPGHKTIYPNLRRVDRNPKDQGNHGAATLGVLVAIDNEYGVSGICPDAEIGIVNPNDETTGEYELPGAILEAAGALAPNSGDIILIEQQAPLGLPAEFEPRVFDAIRHATARGIIVIEPAGNGGKKLNQYDFSKQDSGAIMVGAGYPFIHGVVNASRIPSSNFGLRLDVQGVGLYLASTGYGDLWGQPRRKGDPTWRYTSRFGGTSAAAATVAGVAAVIQGVVKERGLPPLSPALMRTFLIGASTPDYSPPRKRIGPRPDALQAVKALLAEGVPFVNAVSHLETDDQIAVDGIYFAPGRSVIQIQYFGTDGQLTEPLSLPTVFSNLPQHTWPAGMTTRLVTAEVGGITARIPPRLPVVITVMTPGAEPGDEVRSSPRYFVRK